MYYPVTAAKSDSATHIAATILNNVSEASLISSIETISNKIPTIATFNNLRNDPENNKPPVRIAYDQFEHHNKYSKYAKTKYDNINTNNKSYIMSHYMNSCIWLIDQVESLLEKLANKDLQQNNITRTYDYSNITVVSFATRVQNAYNDDIKDILRSFSSIGYDYPFRLVQAIMRKKGYTVAIRDSRANPEHFSQYNSGDELYELSLTTLRETDIETDTTASNTNADTNANTNTDANANTDTHDDFDTDATYEPECDDNHHNHDNAHIKKLKNDLTVAYATISQSIDQLASARAIIYNNLTELAAIPDIVKNPKCTKCHKNCGKKYARHPDSFSTI